MRLRLTSENDPEGNKNVENSDEETSWLDRSKHEDRTNLYAGLLQVLHFDGKSDELVKTEDISKNQAMKASEDFFITSPETGMYKRIRCIPCKKDFDKQCAGHLKRLEFLEHALKTYNQFSQNTSCFGRLSTITLTNVHYPHPVVL